MSHRFSFNSLIESGIGVFYVYTFCDCVQRTMYGAKTDQNQILYLAHAAFLADLLYRCLFVFRLNSRCECVHRSAQAILW